MDHKLFLQLNGKKGQAGLRKKLGKKYKAHMSALAKASLKNKKRGKNGMWIKRHL